MELLKGYVRNVIANAETAMTGAERMKATMEGAAALDGVLCLGVSCGVLREKLGAVVVAELHRLMDRIYPGGDGAELDAFIACRKLSRSAANRLSPGLKQLEFDCPDFIEVHCNDAFYQYFFGGKGKKKGEGKDATELPHLIDSLVAEASKILLAAESKGGSNRWYTHGDTADALKEIFSGNTVLSTEDIVRRFSADAAAMHKMVEDQSKNEEIRSIRSFMTYFSEWCVLGHTVGPCKDGEFPFESVSYELTQIGVIIEHALERFVTQWCGVRYSSAITQAQLFSEYAKELACGDITKSEAYRNKSELCVGACRSLQFLHLNKIFSVLFATNAEKGFGPRENTLFRAFTRSLTKTLKVANTNTFFHLKVLKEFLLNPAECDQLLERPVVLPSFRCLQSLLVVCLCAQASSSIKDSPYVQLATCLILPDSREGRIVVERAVAAAIARSSEIALKSGNIFVAMSHLTDRLRCDWNTTTEAVSLSSTQEVHNRALALCFEKVFARCGPRLVSEALRSLDYYVQHSGLWEGGGGGGGGGGGVFIPLTTFCARLHGMLRFLDASGKARFTSQLCAATQARLLQGRTLATAEEELLTSLTALHDVASDATFCKQLSPATSMTRDMTNAINLRNQYKAMSADLPQPHFAPLPLSAKIWPVLTPEPLLSYFPNPFRDSFKEQTDLFEKLLNPQDVDKNTAPEILLKHIALEEERSGPKKKIKRKVTWCMDYARFVLYDTVSKAEFSLPPCPASVLLCFSTSSNAHLTLDEIAAMVPDMPVPLLKKAVAFLENKPFPFLQYADDRYSLSPHLDTLTEKLYLFDVEDGGKGKGGASSGTVDAPEGAANKDVAIAVLRLCKEKNGVPLSEITALCAGLTSPESAGQVAIRTLKFLQKRGFIEKIAEGGNDVYRRQE